MDSQEQAAADPQREAWRQARRHISEYEERQRELEFDLRREEDRLKAAEEQQVQLKRGMEAMERKKVQHQGKCNELNVELVRLHKESNRLSEEASRTSQQLTLVHAELAKLQEQQAKEWDEMQRHLAEQDEVTAKYHKFGTGATASPATGDMQRAVE